MRGLLNAPVSTSILLVMMASVMGCADMGKKVPADKAIDADEPLAQSASSLAKGEIEPDEVVDAEAIKFLNSIDEKHKRTC